MARKKNKEAAWEREAAKRRNNVETTPRRRVLEGIPDGVTLEQAGVTISRAQSSTEVRVINEYFHKHLTNIGQRATKVPKNPRAHDPFDAVCYLAKDGNAQIIGGINTMAHIPLVTQLAPMYSAIHGISEKDAQLTVARCIRNLAHLLVIPGYENKGIGSLLLKAAEDHERVAGAVEWFGLAEGDDAKLGRFYKRHGFDLHDGDEPEVFKIPGFPVPLEAKTDPKLRRTGSKFRKTFTENNW